MTTERRVVRMRDAYGQMNLLRVNADPSEYASQLARKIGETPNGRSISQHVPRENGHTHIPSGDLFDSSTIPAYDPAERARFTREVRMHGQRPIVVYEPKPR